MSMIDCVRCGRTHEDDRCRRVHVDREAEFYPNPMIERAGLKRGFSNKKPDPTMKRDPNYMKGYKAGLRMYADLKGLSTTKE